MEKFISSQGPAILVKVYIEENQISKVELTDNSQFEYRIIGNCSRLALDLVKKWFDAYLGGGQPPQLHYKLSHLTPFRQKVLQTLKNIHWGKIISYRELAALSGFPRASRAVGSCCRLNPFPLLIPCHRITRADHSLGQFALGCDMKKKLLHFESIKIFS